MNIKSILLFSAFILSLFSCTDNQTIKFGIITGIEYNSKLLDLEPKITEEEINNMTEEQKTAMLLKLLTKK